MFAAGLYLRMPDDQFLGTLTDIIFDEQMGAFAGYEVKVVYWHALK